eukprot:12499-Prorocentrum_minimum.AAC.1
MDGRIEFSSDEIWRNEVLTVNSTVTVLTANSTVTVSSPRSSDLPRVAVWDAGYILPPLLRLVLTLGISRLPSCDWFLRWVYPASPPVIGSYAGYIPPPLLRLALIRRQAALNMNGTFSQSEVAGAYMKAALDFYLLGVADLVLAPIA